MQVEMVFPSGKFGAGVCGDMVRSRATPALVCAWSLPLQKAVGLLTGYLGESEC